MNNLDVDADLNMDVIQQGMSLKYIMSMAITKSGNQTLNSTVTFQEDMVLLDDLSINGKL